MAAAMAKGHRRDQRLVGAAHLAGAHKLQPHGVHSFKLSTDHFAARLREIAGL